MFSCSHPQDRVGAGAFTCRYPSAELGRTKCEIPHMKCSTVAVNCPIPAAVPPLQGRAPKEREPPEETLSCGQPSVAAGPRQVQCTCTLRKILFAYANSNFPPFGMRWEAQSHSEPYMVIFYNSYRTYNFILAIRRIKVSRGKC